MRKIDGCVKCGETREIAARGLCFRCYRSAERAADRQFTYVDRHNPGVRREHIKLLRGFTNVMIGLSELGVPQSEVMAIRRLIDPYLCLIAEFLVSEEALVAGTAAVNGEHDFGTQFTVHMPSHQDVASSSEIGPASEAGRMPLEGS
jgi:hypothetical protein